MATNDPRQSDPPDFSRLKLSLRLLRLAQGTAAHPELHAPPPNAPRTAALKPPQFRLRTLLLVVAAAGALFAALQALSATTALLVLFFLGLIAAHVSGNALGTRLRDETDRLGPIAGDGPPATQPAPASLKASQLTKHRRLPRGLLAFAVLGAILGGIAGGIIIVAVTGSDLSPGGFAVGVGSCGVLGGFAGFLASSFFTVFRGALREALVDASGKHKSG